MCGLFFNTEAGEIVSTNGMNLTIYKLDKPIDSNPFIMPSDFARLISGSIFKNQDEVSLEISEKSIRVTFDDQAITSSLIDERYPDYENAIPECTMEGLINLDELNMLFTRSILFSTNKTGLVRSKFHNGVLTAVSEDLDYGNESVQEMDYEGDLDIEIGLAGKPLTGILKMFSGDATIGMSHPNRALLIYPENTLAKKLTILSMPLMIGPL